MSHHATCQHDAYRLTCEDFEALWAHAKGCCEMCGIPAAEAVGGKLGIDHDHQYGYYAVRGLLCSGCNAFMRLVDHGEKTSHAARTYLANAWFVRVLQARHAENVKERRRVRLAARKPGAELPERPDASYWRKVREGEPPSA